MHVSSIDYGTDSRHHTLLGANSIDVGSEMCWMRWISHSCGPENESPSLKQTLKFV
jgi:hypothetical protein